MLRWSYILLLVLATMLTVGAWWGELRQPLHFKTSITSRFTISLHAEKRGTWLIADRWYAPPRKGVARSLSEDQVPGLLWEVSTITDRRSSDAQTLAHSIMLSASPWLISTVTMVLWCMAPFVSRRALRRKRRLRGLCVTCGYDLTGNESGRCPECGALL